MHKLGIIVPYRDRAEQLETFIKYIKGYLTNKDFMYRIIVVEQDDKESFNRGALLNVGFREAVKQDCDYVVFHDVDLLPEKVDYTYSDVPLELVHKIIDPNKKGFELKVTDLTDDYFGGVTIFPVETFQKINGYSNRYVGWGFEDNDLLYRCRLNQIPLGYKKYRQYNNTVTGLTFDGEHSYVQVPFLKNSVRTRGISFLVNFRVEDLKANPELPHDECAIFCIPGLDAALCYESFGTYKFEIFDNYEDVYSIHSQKLPTGISMQAIVVLDTENHQIKLYLNGRLIGTKEYPENRYLKFGSNEIYLGVGHPTREVTSNSSQKWFKGQISDFATFGRVLDPVEIKKIYREGYLGLNKFKPQQWYSATVLGEDSCTILNIADSFQTNLIGTVVGCTVDPFITLENFYRFTVPLKRKGIFIEQPHETNGTEQGYWKSWATRVNQIRCREAESFGLLNSRDGLSNIQEITKVRKILKSAGDITYLKVKFK